jgi:hypothetical protein
VAELAPPSTKGILDFGLSIDRKSSISLFPDKMSQLVENKTFEYASYYFTARTE